MEKKSTEVPSFRKHQLEETSRVFKFIKDFSKESDRAAVIVGAAKLDESLYQMLVAFLLPVGSSNDELLDSDRPLGTFSARIHACQRLGLIDAELARALHLIRRIRNSFAHDAGGATLESGGHADRIRELLNPLRKYDGFEKARDLIASEHQGLAAEFRTVLALLATRLEHSAESVRRVSCTAVTFVPDVWKAPGEQPANSALQQTTPSPSLGPRS
jgi:hypothetical protein